jgi:hypothetical protein
VQHHPPRNTLGAANGPGCTDGKIRAADRSGCASNRATSNPAARLATPNRPISISTAKLETL